MTNEDDLYNCWDFPVVSLLLFAVVGLNNDMRWPIDQACTQLPAASVEKVVEVQLTIKNSDPPRVGREIPNSTLQVRAGDPIS